MLVILLALSAVLPVGERLTYRVKLGPLTAGTLMLDVAGVREEAGESCYHLVSVLQSNRAYAGLFWLDDTIETYARTRDFVTLRNRKHVHEGSYENEIESGFDYGQGTVTYSDSTALELPGESRDLLSLWYYCRDTGLSMGDEFSVSSHVDKRDYDVTIRVTGRETVTTRIGTFRCLVVETKSSGRTGNGRFSLTDDERRIPVLIRTRMPFGYVSATISRIEEGE